MSVRSPTLHVSSKKLSVLEQTNKKATKKNKKNPLKQTNQLKKKIFSKNFVKEEIFMGTNLRKLAFDSKSTKFLPCKNFPL